MGRALSRVRAACLARSSPGGAGGVSRGPEPGRGRCGHGQAEGRSTLGGPGRAGPGALEEPRREPRPRRRRVVLADVEVAGSGERSRGPVANVGRNEGRTQRGTSAVAVRS